MKKEKCSTLGAVNLQKKAAAKPCAPLNAQELQNLVAAAQKGDRQAIDSLCAAFEPLVVKEAHASYIQEALGEDALNTAWLIFLNFMQNYKRNNFRQLPGLIKTILYHKLLWAARHRLNGMNICSLETVTENALPLTSTTCEIEAATFKIALPKLMAQLSPLQQRAVQALVLERMSIADYCLRYECSSKTAYKHRKKALEKLKTLLNQ